MVVCDENLGVIEMGEHDWDVFELVDMESGADLRWCLVPLFSMMVPGVRYWKRISSLIGTSIGVVMVGRLEAGEVGRILKCGSPSTSSTKAEVAAAMLYMKAVSSKEQAISSSKAALG